jgi:hypothetical protein
VFLTRLDGEVRRRHSDETGMEVLDFEHPAQRQAA